MLRGLSFIVVLALLAQFGACRKEKDQPDQNPPSIVSNSNSTVSKSSNDASHPKPTPPPEDQDADSNKPDDLGGVGYLDFSEDDPKDEGLEGVVSIDEKRSCPGYNLYTNIPFNSAELIDSHGKVIQSWSYQPSKRWVRCELLSNGDVLVVGASVKKVKGVKNRTPHYYGYVMRMSWDGKVIWKKDNAAHHDAELTPRGQILVITEVLRHVPEFEKDIRDNNLELLSSDGEVIQQNSLYDLFLTSPGTFKFQPIVTHAKKEPPTIDLLHANSVEWMYQPELAAKNPLYALSNVLVSSRHQDTIAIINWDKKKLLWAWGQGELEGQHEASVLKNGNILLFDNGDRRRGSRVVEVNPLTNKIVWQYKADNPKDFYSASRGTCQLLPNGNILVANSNSGEAFEITRAGEIVWRFLNPHHDKEEGNRGTIRIKRYPLEFVDKIIKDFSSNKP